MEETPNYNDYGLAIGLISYSFKTDGKKLFREVFKDDLFKKHVENLNLFAREGESLDKNLYKPIGYRLFGNHGIAVLSLMDDYAFCNRIFNNNHTHAAGNDYKWQAKILTGVGSSKDYLYKKAQQTFLRGSDRYPFIGIMKLKVDYRLLYGKGIQYTELVKKAIEKLSPSIENFDYFVVDCFDNDEMAVIAYSTSLRSISSFMENVRKLEHRTVVTPAPENEQQKSAPEKNKHVFTSCHINLGYDVDFEIEKKGMTINTVSYQTGGEYKPTFLPINRDDLVDDHDLVFICEAKPGHTFDLHIQIKDYFKKHIQQDSRDRDRYKINTSITGGSVIHVILPALYIGVIENMCVDNDCKKHICRVKISLRNANENEDITPEIQEGHEYQQQKKNRFDVNFMNKMKEQLNKCGVSKSVRERLLSLYHTYNDSVGNLLHSTYFEELEWALQYETDILDDFLNDETKTIKAMDDELSTHILLFEEAFYNRFHEKGLSHSNNLEYNGSVQQYLTSFDTLYKQLYRIIVPDRNVAPKPALFKTAFASITGHERVSSTRRNLQLNINQITYPEFLATTVWKELANHCNFILYDLVPTNSTENEDIVSFKVWKEFITSPEAFGKIKFFLDKKSLASHNDEVYKVVHSRLDSEFLRYLMADQIVFHFGFQRNFRLFWHFYWKTFLQTSRMFSRKGEINMTLFIDMLLRLIIVRESCASNLSKKAHNDLITEQKSPYDSMMSELWQASYNKVCDCAQSIFGTLETYNFSVTCQEMIYWMEKRLSNITPYLKIKYLALDLNHNGDVTKKNQEIIEMRRELTSSIRSELTKCELVEVDNEFLSADGALSPLYALCLLPAYLQEVMALDFQGKQNAIIKSVPRDKNGEKLCFDDGSGRKRSFVKDTDIANHLLNMPADPLGGVLILGFDIRKKYFSLRTTLYRNLWNYKMLTEEPL